MHVVHPDIVEEESWEDFLQFTINSIATVALPPAPTELPPAPPPVVPIYLENLLPALEICLWDALGFVDCSTDSTTHSESEASVHYEDGESFSALAMDEDDKVENEGNDNSCKSQVSSGAVSMASEHENSCKSSSIPSDELLQRYQRDFILAYEQQLTKMQQETFEIMHAQLRNLLDKQAAREDRLVTQIQSLARSQGDICKDQALLRQSLGALASNSDNSLTNAKHVSTSAELERGEFVKGLMQRTICESVNEIFTERFKQGDQPCSFQSMLDRDA